MDRRTFIASAAALLTTPALVRAGSLEYVPRLPSLILENRRIVVDGTLDLRGYRKVVIRHCDIVSDADLSDAALRRCAVPGGGGMTRRDIADPQTWRACAEAATILTTDPRPNPDRSDARTRPGSGNH